MSRPEAYRRSKGKRNRRTEQRESGFKRVYPPLPADWFDSGMGAIERALDRKLERALQKGRLP